MEAQERSPAPDRGVVSRPVPAASASRQRSKESLLIARGGASLSKEATGSKEGKPLRSATRFFKGDSMRCHRCSGIMIYEKFYGDCEHFFGWRCIVCGEIVDQVILENRLGILQ